MMNFSGLPLVMNFSFHFQHISHSVPKDCQCSDCKPGLPYWEIVSYTCGSIVSPLAIISIICAFCGRRCRKHEAREENVGCWKKIAKCCRTCSHCCFSFWKRKSVSRPIPEGSERLLDRESGLSEASAPIVDESEHEASEEKVGYLERTVRFCNSCFCCCQCFWKKRSFSLPIPESCEEDDQDNRDAVSTCSLVEGSVEAELVGTAHGSTKEREEEERMAGRKRMAERESEETVEDSKHISAMEETDSKLDTSQKPGDSGPVSAHSEVVSLLQPETTENSRKLALSKHKSLSTDKQQSKKVRSRKRPLEEGRQRKVGEKDIAEDELPKNRSLEQNHIFNTWPLVTESIAEESSDVPSNSRRSSAIHNTSKCRTVVEQNEAVDYAYLVDGSEGNNVEEVSMDVESQINITYEPQSKILLSSRKTEIDVKDISVQKVQKQCSSESGYCSRQTSRQDSQQLGAEDLQLQYRVSSTCLVNRQKSSDSALASDSEEN